MATHWRNATSGHTLVQFACPRTKKRRTLRLGKLTIRQADQFLRNLENLITSVRCNIGIDSTTADWVAGLGANIARKLESWKLITARNGDLEQIIAEDDRRRLLAFVTSYIVSRTDVSERTRTNYRLSERFLKEHFSADKLLANFTAYDAKEFRRKLLAAGHSENYVRTQCKNAKLFMSGAVDDKLITDNPFKGVPCRIQPVPEKMRLVDEDSIRKVIASTPDPEFRLLIAFARWGGVRVPSEIVDFRWSDIDWQEQTITVRVPKLKRFQGKGTRKFPIFWEMRDALLEASKNVPDSSAYVFPRLRESTNLRSPFNRYCELAKVAPWIRPFQNMRSTRETELTAIYGIKTVCEWLGHDPKISLANYQQITPESWKQAAERPEAL